jgi:transposase
MPKTRPPFAPEFLEQIVALMRTSRMPEELAREDEPTEPPIRSWVAQADRDRGVRADDLSFAEKEEVRRFRRENRILRQEKEILERAAALFARDSSSISERDSSS